MTATVDTLWLSPTAAALIGPFVADCQSCLDVPLRFGTEEARDRWASGHRAFTLHQVQRTYDASLVQKRLARR